jgi:hypothetical protein
LLVISFQVLSFVGLGTLITLNIKSLRNSNRMNLDSPLIEGDQGNQ